MLLLQSALKQLLSEDLLDKFLTALSLDMVFFFFFCEMKVRRILGSESLGCGDKAPEKKFHYKFRESLKRAWIFLKLIVSSFNRRRRSKLDEFKIGRKRPSSKLDVKTA